MDTLDNNLIRQKDHILSLVRDDQFEEANTLLEFIKPLWEAFDYRYKYDEVKAIIKERIREYARDATHWKTEQKWLAMLVSCTKLWVTPH